MPELRKRGLIVGDGDALLPQSIDLAAGLRARGIPVEQLMLPDEVHFLLRHQSWNRTFQATRDYLDRHLMPFDCGDSRTAGGTVPNCIDFSISSERAT